MKKPLLSFVLFGLLHTLPSQAAILDLLFSEKGAEIQIDLESDPKKGPYFFISVLASLGTGDDLYIYDRVPGMADMGEALLHSEVMEGKVVTHKIYRVYLRSILEHDSDRASFLSGNIALEFRMHSRAEGDSFEPGMKKRIFKLVNLEEIGGCGITLLGLPDPSKK